jgi:(4S)-4-hydroxy-5-phosphonooxypentane-2,3-dione isomerase
MYVVSVTVCVIPERLDAFIQATLDNARNTRLEPGNVRFDVLQAEEPPTRFLLYEAYRSPDDFAAHQKTDHYLTWRETVADMMAQPRQGVRHHSVFFE